MLRLFRHIRQRLFLEGKVSRYLGYAIGEIVLIVVGIMIALEANEWKEERQLLREREELISNLIIDFQTTKSRVSTAVELAESLVERTTNFRLADPFDESIPVETLANYAGGAFVKIQFEPALATYEGAISNGKMALIKSPTLQEDFLEYNQMLDNYEQGVDIGGQIQYVGLVAEVKKEFGTIGNIIRINVDRNGEPLPERFHLTEDEYRKRIAQPVVFGAIDVMHNLNFVMARDFRKMSESVDSILTELERLQNNF